MRIIYFLVLFLAGCETTIQPNQTRVVFDSNPPGATISSNNQSYGIAPVARIWTLNDINRKTFSPPITATWASGAKFTVTLNLIPGQNGNFIINRPQGVDGLASDVQWGISHQQQIQKKADENFAAWNTLINKNIDNQER